MLANVVCKGLELKGDEVGDCLFTFVRRNTSLMHLDLTYLPVGLGPILKVCEACTKSRSLASIHLTNPMMDSEAVRQQIRQVLRPRRRVKQKTTFDEPESDDQNLPLQTRPHAQESSPNPNQRINTSKHHKELEVRNYKLIYTRFLGHFEMPGQYRWAEASSCFDCERHNYTVFVVSRSLCDQFFAAPTAGERKFLKQRIERAVSKFDQALANSELEFGSDNDEHFYDADKDEGLQDTNDKDLYSKNQQIAGKFSGWRPKSLIPL